jgi:hypothetical protein
MPRADVRQEFVGATDRLLWRESGSVFCTNQVVPGYGRGRVPGRRVCEIVRIGTADAANSDRF